MNKNIYHRIAVVLAIISIVLAVVLLIWGEKGSVFIAIIPVLIAGAIERMGKKTK
jgi:xanthine/uracil/vitamin C permease (AzgA family)